jgi:hypothetical protein
MFAGLVHEIGQFYLLARASAFPALLQREAELGGLMYSFSHSVGRAVLESLKVPEQIVTAVDDSSIDGAVVPPRTLADVLFLAESMAAFPNPSATHRRRRKACWPTLPPRTSTTKRSKRWLPNQRKKLIPSSPPCRFERLLKLRQNSPLREL